jgi:hypothetical protein
LGGIKMGFGSIFGKKKDLSKLDIWRIEDQIVSDGQAILLTDKDAYPMKLMYLSDDVMDGETLKIGKILEKNGYQNLDLKSFDGNIITGEVKGHYFHADKIFDFKEINGLK